MQPSPGPLWGLYADSLFVGRLVRKNDPFTGLVLDGTVTHGPWLDPYKCTQTLTIRWKHFTTQGHEEKNEDVPLSEARPLLLPEFVEDEKFVPTKVLALQRQRWADKAPLEAMLTRVDPEWRAQRREQMLHQHVGRNSILLNASQGVASQARPGGAPKAAAPAQNSQRGPSNKRPHEEDGSNDSDAESEKGVPTFQRHTPGSAAKARRIMDEPGYAPGLDMLLRASELPSETKLRSGSQPQHTAPKHAAPKQASAKPQQTAPKQTAPKQQQAVAKPQQAAAKQAVATKQAPVKPQQAAVKPQQAAPKPQQAAPKQAPPPKPQEQAAPRLRQTSQPVPPAKKGASAKEDSGATVTRHGNTTGKALPAQPVPVPDPLDKYQDKKLYKRGWNGVNYPRDELEKEGDYAVGTPEPDDGAAYDIEYILDEYTDKTGKLWVLVKWKEWACDIGKGSKYVDMNHVLKGHWEPLKTTIGVGDPSDAAKAWFYKQFKSSPPQWYTEQRAAQQQGKNPSHSAPKSEPQSAGGTSQRNQPQAKRQRTSNLAAETTAAF